MSISGTLGMFVCPLTGEDGTIILKDEAWSCVLNQAVRINNCRCCFSLRPNRFGSPICIGFLYLCYPAGSGRNIRTKPDQTALTFEIAPRDKPNQFQKVIDATVRKSGDGS